MPEQDRSVPVNAQLDSTSLHLCRVDESDMCRLVRGNAGRRALAAPGMQLLSILENFQSLFPNM